MLNINAGELTLASGGWGGGARLVLITPVRAGNRGLQSQSEKVCIVFIKSSHELSNMYMRRTNGPTPHSLHLSQPNTGTSWRPVYYGHSHATHLSIPLMADIV